MAVQNIIFDLGNVLVDIEPKKTFEAFANLSSEPLSRDFFYSFQEQHEFVDDYECGRITTSAFRAEVKRRLRLEATDEQIDEAWNAMLLDIPQAKLDWLAALKHKYRLFVLSNTNELHISWVDDFMSRFHPKQQFADFFEVAYYSHQIGCRKPEAAAYLHILNRHQLQAEECLFIDDRVENIEAAAALKIETIWLRDRDKTIEKVEEILC